MGQKFYAHPTDTFTWPNDAIGHRSGVFARINRIIERLKREEY